MKLAVTLLLTSALAIAETPISFTATTDNVAGAPDSIKIDVFRWSTDAERDQLLAAWNLTAPAATSAGRGGGGGRGGEGVEAVAQAPRSILPPIQRLWTATRLRHRQRAVVGEAGVVDAGARPQLRRLH